MAVCALVFGALVVLKVKEDVRGPYGRGAALGVAAAALAAFTLSRIPWGPGRARLAVWVAVWVAVLLSVAVMHNQYAELATAFTDVLILVLLVSCAIPTVRRVGPSRTQERTVRGRGDREAAPADPGALAPIGGAALTGVAIWASSPSRTRWARGGRRPVGWELVPLHAPLVRGRAHHGDWASPCASRLCSAGFNGRGGATRTDDGPARSVTSASWSRGAHAHAVQDTPPEGAAWLQRSSSTSS